MKSGDFGLEEGRIKEAYARRASAGVGDRYGFFEWGNLFIIQDRERRLLKLLKQIGLALLDGKRILEIGCGTGFWIREFIKWGARPENIVGIELLEDRVAMARSTCPKGVTLQHGNAARLSFKNESFDLVLQSTVFTSILDVDLRRSIAAEMQRVLKPDGFLLWYDYHVKDPRNHDVRAVRKREIQELFPHCRIHLQRVTLAPPLTRVLAPRSWLLCTFLAKIPLLCTHYLGVIQKG